MNLISKLLQAALAGRRVKEGGRKTRTRSAIAVEQLDHRQLLSVNFTGNVTNDFLATKRPGVVVISSLNTKVSHPQFPIAPPAYAIPLKNDVQLSGFDLSEIRVSYDKADDTLSIGLNQPPNPKNPPNSVIAADADNNGNSGVVGSVVSNLAMMFGQNFQEWPGLGGPQEMAAFLSLNPAAIGSMTPEVVAGFPLMPPPGQDTPPKAFEVAQVVNGVPGEAPMFDQTNPVYPLNAGNVYLVNSSAHPNLEFGIKNFSLLYQAVTGSPLTPQSEIAVGAFAGSHADGGIGQAFIQEFAFPLSEATVPPPTTQSPYILINPHEHRFIDTMHNDLIRVTIFGTSGFHVKNIVPSSVRLDGVSAEAYVVRKFKRDEFRNATYFFNAKELNGIQPRGLDFATLTGMTTDGAAFESAKKVLNRPYLAGRWHKYKRGGSIQEALLRLVHRHPKFNLSGSSLEVPVVSPRPEVRSKAPVTVNYTPAIGSRSREERTNARPMVSIPRLAAHEHHNVPRRLRHSLNDHLEAGHLA
jgi:hypothetical protein